MPSLPFVLPHWLYWGTLVVFPLVAIYFVNRQRKRGVPKGASLFIAYMFWLCSGFMGLHRFYLRNNWGFVFIPVFLLILHTTDDIRDRREDVSRTRAAVETTQFRDRPRKDTRGRDGDARDDGPPDQGAGGCGERQIRFRRRARRSRRAGTAIRAGWRF